MDSLNDTQVLFKHIAHSDQKKLTECLTTLSQDACTTVGQLLATIRDNITTNAAGKTALHLAARQSNFSLVRRLAGAGVHHDTRDIQGFTALHRGAALRAGAAVQVLLAEGANLNVRNSAGHMAFGTAVRMATRGQPTGGALGALLRSVLNSRTWIILQLTSMR